MEYIGYLLALLMGVVLGSIGGGGSILTVPILVYFFHITPTTATGYSLLIVGLTAAFASIGNFKKGLIDIKTSIIFAIPSVIMVYITRLYILPSIPSQIISQPFSLTRDTLIMLLFAALMLVSAIFMLKNKVVYNKKSSSKINVPLIIIEGLLVGLFTGLLGAGGGFLIIPALVIFLGMPMKKAIASSLLIITAKSLIGFVGDVQTGIEIDYKLLLIIVSLTFLGILISSFTVKNVSDKILQKSFAVFVLCVAPVIIISELFF